MENASKALLIAGAVLIVILLIGLGMLIYSKSTGVVDTAADAMNSREIQTFNSQFSSYEGTQKGSSVRAMLSAVIANNATYKDEPNRQIGVRFTENVASMIKFKDDYLVNSSYHQKAEELSAISKYLSVTTNYEISFTDFNNGLIQHIEIDK